MIQSLQTLAIQTISCATRRDCAMPDLPPGRAYSGVTSRNNGGVEAARFQTEPVMVAHPRSGMAQSHRPNRLVQRLIT